MLKSAFLLLLLLNSLRISTANSTIEEQQTNGAIEFFNKMAKLDDAMEQLKEMKIHGAKLYEANDELNALDEIPLQSGWVNESHVELCSGFPALRDKNSSEISSYNFTFLIQYDNFGRDLSKIPDSEVDIKKLKIIFYHSFSEKDQLKVTQKAHKFSQRLQCLQTIKSMNNKELIGNMTDLYETYCYADMYSQYKTEKRIKKLTCFFEIFTIVISVIAFCFWACSD